MRIIRTVSSKILSKSVSVKTRTKSGFLVRTIPIRVTVKATKVRVVR